MRDSFLTLKDSDKFILLKIVHISEKCWSILSSNELNTYKFNFLKIKYDLILVKYNRPSNISKKKELLNKL